MDGVFFKDLDLDLECFNLALLAKAKQGWRFLQKEKYFHKANFLDSELGNLKILYSPSLSSGEAIPPSLLVSRTPVQGSVHYLDHSDDVYGHRRTSLRERSLSWVAEQRQTQWPLSSEIVPSN
ncbi:hypothetical protein FH972_001099 [Carpinus fangiana]|uniref:Uncharacterized protein n=1 Tax=Carpinus fangiana TaxID=176857 RepID=A0A5N6QAP5_9ROSI|nr:hypothetical protein FH972_001099 [Carpinus fangiana]